MRRFQFICKTLLILAAVRISIKYWMLIDTPLLYWGVSGILLCSWNHVDFGKKVNKAVMFLGAVALSVSVFTTYMVNNQFIFNCRGIFKVIDLAFLFLVSWVLLGTVFLLFDWISSRRFVMDIDITKTGIGEKKTFVFVFIFILLMWIPYFLTWYPGLIFGDSLHSIYQAMGAQDWSNHFPVVYTLFVKVCVQVGMAVGNLNIGYAVYTLLQMIIMTSVFAYSVCWLRHKNFSTLAVICCLFYAFEPCFPQHAIAMWKDGIFSVSLLYLSIQLFDLVISDESLIHNKRFLINIIISSVVICFFRNNGVYIIAFICLSLALHLYFDRNYYKNKVKFIICYCALIVMYFIVAGPVYGTLGIDDDEVEKYGILLQQVGQTVVEDGNIGEEEQEFLNQLLPIAKYKDVYNPGCVDSIKWDLEFNNNFFEENQNKFIHVWFKLFTKNPKTFIKAYLQMTYQYWVPNAWENNKYSINIISGNLDTAVNNPWGEAAEVRYHNFLETNLTDTKQIFSITTPMMAVGILVWFMLLIILYAIINKKYSFILPLTPSLGALITLLIATPANYWPRYMLIIYCMLPIMAGMIPLIGKSVAGNGS